MSTKSKRKKAMKFRPVVCEVISAEIVEYFCKDIFGRRITEKKVARVYELMQRNCDEEVYIHLDDYADEIVYTAIMDVLEEAQKHRKT